MGAPARRAAVLVLPEARGEAVKPVRCPCGCPLLVLPGDRPRARCVRCIENGRAMHAEKTPERWQRAARVEQSMRRLMGAARGEE